MNNKETINKEILDLGSKLLDKIEHNISKVDAYYTCYGSQNYPYAENKVVFTYRNDKDEFRCEFYQYDYKKETFNTKVGINQSYHINLYQYDLNNEKDRFVLNEDNYVKANINDLSDKDNFERVKQLFDKAIELCIVVTKDMEKRDFSDKKTVDLKKKILDFQYLLNK